VLVVVFAHHRQQLFQGYFSDVLKYANVFQILGWHWSDCLNVILSGASESAQCFLKTLAVVIALLGEFVAIDVRQEGLLLAEKFTDPDAVTLSLDVAKMTTCSRNENSSLAGFRLNSLTSRFSVSELMTFGVSSRNASRS